MDSAPNFVSQGLRFESGWRGKKNVLLPRTFHHPSEVWILLNVEKGIKH